MDEISGYLGNLRWPLLLDKLRTQLIQGQILLVALMCLEGCSSVTGPVSYPISWAPTNSNLTKDGCLIIEGVYNNQGAEAFPPEFGDPPRLSNVFTLLGWGPRLSGSEQNDQVWSVLPDAVSVAIVQLPETLEITFLGENEQQVSLDFRRYHINLSEDKYDDLFYCYDSEMEPRLRFFAKPEGFRTSSIDYVGAGGTIVFLLKATDGSLIVQWRKESFEISRFINGGNISFHSVWWRYPPLKTSQ